MDEIVCIGCGCTDECPCVLGPGAGTCSWVAVETDIGVGICSVCAAKPLSELVGQFARDIQHPGRVAGVRIHRLSVEAA